MEARNLFPEAMWKSLKLQGFGNSQLLRLCRQSERIPLARMIIMATYSVEIQAIAQTESQTSPTSTLDNLTLRFELLERKTKVHALLRQTDST